MLLSADSDHIVLEHVAQPSKPLRYKEEEVVGAGYRAVWFLFKGEPFDIGRFYRPDGTWTGFYVDILEPVHWEADNPQTLKPIVDLFLDLWIAPDGNHLVLDEDEFSAAVCDGVLTDVQAIQARETLLRLTSVTKAGLFPPADVRDFAD